MTIDLGNGLEAASSLALHIIMGKSIVFGILYRSTDSWSMKNREGKNEFCSTFKGITQQILRVF